MICCPRLNRFSRKCCPIDATVVIVSLAVQGDERAQRLVGSYLTDTDFARGAALSVLHATNRILGNRFFMR
jgi:hypothetical protein